MAQIANCTILKFCILDKDFRESKMSLLVSTLSHDQKVQNLRVFFMMKAMYASYWYQYTTNNHLSYLFLFTSIQRRQLEHVPIFY